MPQLKPGETLSTEKPYLIVEGLSPGSHIFQLEVLDEEGNKSLPTWAEVIVRPGSVLDPIREIVLSGRVSGFRDIS